MSDFRPLPAAARTLLCSAMLCVASGSFAAAQKVSPAPRTAPSAPVTRSPQPAQPDRSAQRLRSQPLIGLEGVAPGEVASVRLMVFSLHRQRVFDALTLVRPLLSTQGSVELDPNDNTISVRDNLAALSRVAIAIRAFDRESQPVRIDVQLIDAETAKISPVSPSPGIAPDLLDRLRQLLRFQSFSLLAHGQIESREGEAVVYEMAQGYRLSFELGTIADGKRIRLSGFRMAHAQQGEPEHELVRTVVHLGLDQPLILGLTRDESSDRALLLVLRYGSGAAGR